MGAVPSFFVCVEPCGDSIVQKDAIQLYEKRRIQIKFRTAILFVCESLAMLIWRHGIVKPICCNKYVSFDNCKPFTVFEVFGAVF